MQWSGDDVAMGREAMRKCVIYSALVDVANGDALTAGLACHGRGEQADGAGAHDEGCGARLGFCAVDGVDGY